MTAYSVLYLLAIVAGTTAVIVEGRRRGFDTPQWIVIATGWAIGGMIGAELPYALLGDLAAPRTAVGAVAGATLALFVAAQLLGIDAGRALDTTAVAIPWGGALARLGCFAAQCCAGTETRLWFGVVDDAGIRRHPTQLYEAAVDVAIALWFQRSKRVGSPGTELEFAL